jgi:hypothetical protein
MPVIREIRRAGATPLHQIAEALNVRGISGHRGVVLAGLARLID